MNALTTISAVELALLRLESAKHDRTSLYALFHGRDTGLDEDRRLDEADTAVERAESELRHLATEALGIDVQRLCNAIS
ncbi:MAG TPA: hypothetical protein VGQ34_11550 [Sphingomicrobium sp.]|jgi:hypothetical protein|nr:hypothetical protein [Sphingomicrobium sp.]